MFASFKKRTDFPTKDVYKRQGKRLAVILVMFLFFGGLSIYITVSSLK